MRRETRGAFKYRRARAHNHRRAGSRHRVRSVVGLLPSRGSYTCAHTAKPEDACVCTQQRVIKGLEGSRTRLCMKFCVHYKCAQPCWWERDRSCSPPDKDENNGDRETGERWGESREEREREREWLRRGVTTREGVKDGGGGGGRVWSPDHAGLGWA